VHYYSINQQPFIPHIKNNSLGIINHTAALTAQLWWHWSIQGKRYWEFSLCACYLVDHWNIDLI